MIKDNLILGLITLIVAIITFMYGLRINKRKIIVINAKYTILINLVATLYLTVVIFSILEGMQKYRWSLQSFIIIGFIMVLGLIFFMFSPVNLNVFNAREDVIYDALKSILSQHGVDYECEKSKIFIANSKVFIRIWYNKSSKTCTLSLSNTKFPEIIGKVFEDFKSQLNNQKSDLKSRTGAIFIFLSMMLFILAILFLVLWLLI